MRGQDFVHFVDTDTDSYLCHVAEDALDRALHCT